MIISLIVAMDANKGIGISSQLPWWLPADLKKFRSLTWGHHVVIGRKTYESIGRPLPMRTMIIVTRQKNYQATGCLIAHSIEEALSLARTRGESELFIAGGAELYQQLISRADKLYITEVHTHTKADTFFPEFNQKEWIEQESVLYESDENNKHSFTFKILVRNSY